jgi:hypothetical protein
MVNRLVASVALAGLAAAGGLSTGAQPAAAAQCDIEQKDVRWKTTPFTPIAAIRMRVTWCWRTVVRRGKRMRWVTSTTVTRDVGTRGLNTEFDRWIERRRLVHRARVAGRRRPVAVTYRTQAKFRLTIPFGGVVATKVLRIHASHGANGLDVRWVTS